MRSPWEEKISCTCRNIVLKTTGFDVVTSFSLPFPLFRERSQLDDSDIERTHLALLGYIPKGALSTTPVLCSKGGLCIYSNILPTLTKGHQVLSQNIPRSSGIASTFYLSPFHRASRSSRAVRHCTLIIKEGTCATGRIYRKFVNECQKHIYREWLSFSLNCWPCL